MPYRQGREVHCAKFTEADVRFIRENAKTMTLAELASKFPHISKSAVFKVREFETWKHVK